MNISRQRKEVTDSSSSVGESQQDSQSENLDEALEESFPASDPVAISITAIDPGVKEGKTDHRQRSNRHVIPGME